MIRAICSAQLSPVVQHSRSRALSDKPNLFQFHVSVDSGLSSPPAIRMRGGSLRGARRKDQRKTVVVGEIANCRCGEQRLKLL